MRSDLVFGALSHVSNRYQLCQLASKATRMLHKPNTRLQDTTNEVLVRFHSPTLAPLAPVNATVQQPTRRDAPRRLTASPELSLVEPASFRAAFALKMQPPLPSLCRSSCFNSESCFERSAALWPHS